MIKHVIGAASSMTLVLLASGTAYATGSSSHAATTPPTAYVVCFGSNHGSVVPVDTATNAAGTAITTAPGPGAIAFTPDSETAYVVNYGGQKGTVTPISVDTNTAGKSITP